MSAINKPASGLPANQRIWSIDTFRGITIFVMVFVNELAGVRNIPQWMKHMPAKADGMTFVDLVFPAFLFIVGMSIPFALANRLRKGDSSLQIQQHIAWRTLGLLTLGFFLVNAESGLNAAATGISQHAWMLLFYLAALITWAVYYFKQKKWEYLCRLAGLLILISLAIIYRGKDGTSYMKPHWWGILGLIGWAYLFSTILFQLCRGRMLWLAISIMFCTGWFIVSRSALAAESDYFAWMSGQAGNASHTSIVLCGTLLSQLLFHSSNRTLMHNRFLAAGLFAVLLLTTGFLLRLAFPISKIYATPSWCLISAGICTLLFILLHWLMDVKQFTGWSSFFRPAATNPLLTYLLPGILFSFLSLTGLSIVPAQWRTGIPGICWSVFFSVAIMYAAAGLSRAGIRMQL